MNQDDGGPAYPALTRSEVYDNRDGGKHVAHETAGGMSMLAYFMAHAPAEPQPWFTPNCAALTAPPYPAPLKNMTTKEAADLDGWREGFLNVGEMNSSRLVAHVLDLDASNKARSSYSRNLERQRYLQWPMAWAEAQLAQLKARP